MGKSIAYGILGGVILLGIADALGTRMGLLAGALPRDPGTAAWTSSRAAGVAAYLALSLDVTFGLFISTGRADRFVSRAQTVEVHQWLSSTTLALIGGHVLLLLGDGYARFDLLDAMVPFVHPYRPLAVGLGILAGYLAVVVHGSFSLRRKVGIAVWRRIHRLTFALFVLAAAHGLLAGTDAAAPFMIVTYGTTTGVVATLLVARLLPSSHRGRARRTAEESA